MSELETEQAESVETSETPEPPETPAGPEAEKAEPEGLFDGVEAETPSAEADDVVNTPEKPEEETDSDAERPEWLPEKFKTPEDLVKAYNELGGKLREKNEPPEEYDVKFPNEEVELQEDDAEAFREMGLNNEQAQKLVDYFYENVVPELREARTEVEKQRLASNWGVDAESTEFQQRLVKLKSWASQNLPESAVKEMAKTHNGVNALYQMMQAKAEANLAQGGNTSRPAKADLTKMMEDERYINRDPDFMAHVQKQFQQAFDS